MNPHEEPSTPVQFKLSQIDGSISNLDKIRWALPELSTPELREILKILTDECRRIRGIKDKPWISLVALQKQIEDVGTRFNEVLYLRKNRTTETIDTLEEQISEMSTDLMLFLGEKDAETEYAEELASIIKQILEKLEDEN